MPEPPLINKNLLDELYHEERAKEINAKGKGKHQEKTSGKKDPKKKNLGESESSDSNSDSESSSFSEEDKEEIEEINEEIPFTEPTCRVAILDVRWEVVKAADLWVVCNSFLPPTGIIKSVKIYLSEFGKKAMAEDDQHGPPVWTDGDKVNLEKLRKYEEKKTSLLFRHCRLQRHSRCLRHL